MKYGIYVALYTVMGILLALFVMSGFIIKWVIPAVHDVGTPFRCEGRVSFPSEEEAYQVQREIIDQWIKTYPQFSNLHLYTPTPLSPNGSITFTFVLVGAGTPPCGDLTEWLKKWEDLYAREK